MKESIKEKILKHARKEGTITIKSTSDAVKISMPTAKHYLLEMTIKGLLTIEEQEKDKLEKDKPTGYTYRFWRLNQ